MKGFFSALAIATFLALSVGPAQAAPGDPRVVQGTLEWPATFSAESFVVIRGEESNGMLLAASDGQGVVLLKPDREVAVGSLVK